MFFTFQDAAIVRQTNASLRNVLAPKLAGALALASTTVASPIKSTVYFSSLSALLGTAGQVNYAAANEALNSVAEAQHASGLASVSISWGAWTTGMAIKDPQMLARFERVGIEAFTPTAGIAALASAISSGRAEIVAAPIIWSRLMSSSSAVAAAPIFSSFRTAAIHHSQLPLSDALHTQKVAQDLSIQSSSALPAQPADTIILHADVRAELQAVVESMLGTSVSMDQPLMEVGLDSLTAVELRNTVGNLFGTELPATVIFDYPSISALAGFIAARITPVPLMSQPSPYSVDTALSIENNVCALHTTDVVGISAQYPGHTTGVDGFWGAIMAATDLQRRIPLERWEVEHHYTVDIESGVLAINVPFGAFCEDVAYCDAALFGLSPSEAVTIDPQQRILIEVAHGSLTQAASLDGGQDAFTGMWNAYKRHCFVAEFQLYTVHLLYSHIYDELTRS